jgi:hypothetical protein
MPNIPPLAYNVVKHPVFIAAIFLLLWWLLCFFQPTLANNICVAVGGWFIGVGIFHASEYISNKLQ